MQNTIRIEIKRQGNINIVKKFRIAIGQRIALTISFLNVLKNAYKKNGKQTAIAVEDRGSFKYNDIDNAEDIKKNEINAVVFLLILEYAIILFISIITLILRQNRIYGRIKIKNL